MELVRLLGSDGSLERFKNNWTDQCNEISEDFDSFCDGSIELIENIANSADTRDWAIGIFDGDDCMAIACAIRANQKGEKGWTLRIREVSVCPKLDYGKAPETAYSETLIALLIGAIKLSERELVADNIKLHLRSPQDAVFFRAFGNTLDSKGVFAATETHGAWLTIRKGHEPPLQSVK